MAKRQRTSEEHAEIYQRRKARSLAQTGKGYGYLKRLDNETRERLRLSYAEVDESYARTLTGKYKPRARIIEQPEVVQLAGGEYAEAQQATAIKQIFRNLGDRQVAFRISFDDDERFISMIKKDISPDLKPGEGRGSSGRSPGQYPDAPVRFYFDDGAGLRASDVLHLIDFFGSTYDALFSVWEGVSP